MEGRPDCAIAQEDCAIEKRTSHFSGIERGDADEDGRASGHFGRDAGEFLRAAMNEAAAHEEVAGKVPHEGQLGRDDEVGAESLRLADAAHDERGVAADIARGWIDLKQRNAQTEAVLQLLVYLYMETGLRF